MAPLTLSHDDYTVAWISALPHEMAAGRAVFDQIHENLPPRRGDTNTYILGSISGHNVAMVCLPAGSIGTNSAAAVVNHLRSTFTNVEYGLMVGIGGGAPSKKFDIRLGDVVVSRPVDKYPGVVQYDFGKTITGGRFEQTGTLNRPPDILLGAISSLEARYSSMDSPISAIVRERLTHNPQMASFACPGRERDQLFESSYSHPEFEDDCSQCDTHYLVEREPRSSEEPHIWYGLIASGNQVVKDGPTRDAVSEKFQILCFEMEAAGIMNYLPCLVIRGICDYCDSHKKKKWQGYAAMTAAAYGKLLLSTVPRISRPHEDSANNQAKPTLTTEEVSCRQRLFLTDPEEDMNRLKRRKGGYVPGTCAWMLETEQLNTWLGHSQTPAEGRPNILWLYGNPGVGKSTMAIALAELLPLQSSFQNGEKTLAYFFCESSSDKHRTAISILRGLLYQLIQKRPSLMKLLMEKYVVQNENLFASFDALWSVLLAAGMDLGEIYCIIDALDECQQESQEAFLSQLLETFGGHEQAHRNHGVHITITSRPYQEIRRYLRQFCHADISVFPELREDVSKLIEEKVDELSKTNDYPPRVKQEVAEILQEKADGTSLWVGIACGELRHVPSKDAVKTLRRLPRTLDALYRDLLVSARKRSPEEYDVILHILRFVAIALRPLELLELSELCGLYVDYGVEERYAFTRDCINMCRLLVVVQDNTVSLLHKSLKDFLFQGEFRVVDEKSLHADFAYRCLDRVIKVFSSYDVYEYDFHPDSFVFYSAGYWQLHAHLSGPQFTVLERHAAFFASRSSVRDAWNEFQLRHSGEYLPHTLEIAAKQGILPLLHYVFAEETQEQFQGWHKYLPNALRLSALNGHIDVFSSLLDRCNDMTMIISENIMSTAVCHSRSSKELTGLLLDRWKREITDMEPVSMQVAKYGTEQAFQVLLHHRKDEFKVTRNFIKGIFLNKDHGAEILSVILDRFGQSLSFTGDILQVAARYADERRMALLLDRTNGELSITEEFVQEVVFNEKHGLAIMKLLLNRFGRKVPLSEKLDLFCAEQWDEELVELVLDHLENKVPTMRSLLGRWTWNRDKALLLLFRSRGDLIPVSWKILDTAVEEQNKDLLSLLLDKPETQNLVTPELAVVATRCGSKECLRLLLEKFPDKITITEEIVLAADQNWRSQGIVKLLVGHLEKEFCPRIDEEQEIIKGFQHRQSPPSRDIAMAAVSWGWMNGVEMFLVHVDETGWLGLKDFAVIIAEYGSAQMVSLIDERGLWSKIPIDNEMIVAAARNTRCGDEMMELLLDRECGRIPLSEEVFREAARNIPHGRQILALLFDKSQYGLPITPDMIHAAAFYQYQEDLLCLDWVDEMTMLDDMIFQVSGRGDPSHLGLLLHRYGPRIRITEEALSQFLTLPSRAATIQLLLHHRGRGLPFSGEVIEMMAHRPMYLRDSQEPTDILLDHLGHAFPITEEVIIHCSMNCDQDTVVRLLQLAEGNLFAMSSTSGSVADDVRGGTSGRNHEVQLLHDVAKASVENLDHGAQILEFLLTQYGDVAVPCPGELVMAACRRDNIKVLSFLLSLQKDKIQITTELLLAAAEASYQMVELLLDRNQNSPPLTRETLRAVIGSPGDERVAEKILQTELSCRQGDISFIKSLVQNLGYAKQVPSSLLAAAICNDAEGYRLTEYLLDMAADELEVTDEIVEAAARNDSTYNPFLKILFDRFGDKVPVTETALEAAAARGTIETMEILLDYGGHILITESIVKAALSNSDPLAMTRLILRRRGQIPVTEDLLIASGGDKSRKTARGFTRLVVTEMPDLVKDVLSERVLTATAASAGMETLQLFRQRFGTVVPHTLKLVSELSIAITAQDVRGVKRLLRQGAPPDTRDCDGRTPLWKAAQRGRLSVVEALLETHSVDINAADNEGDTPLLIAVIEGHSSIVRFLLEAGADPNIANSVYGETAYSLAEEKLYLRIMRTLKEYGAK